MMLAAIQSRPWKKSHRPGKVLAIRFQALGDTIITLPYLKDFKSKNPSVAVHFLTRKEVSAVPSNVVLFENVITVGGGRNVKLQFLFLLMLLPYLWLQRYDAVLDLQNNKISRIMRKLLFVGAYVEFDRESPISAGERTKNTINALGLNETQMASSFQFQTRAELVELIDSSLINIVLNPAGYCQSRHWPLENYGEFANLWIERLDRRVKFILLLMPAFRESADYLEKMLGERCINLTGRANQVEAFQILSKCSLIVSEDSGLMHMAWVQGIPTVALFSSSRKDWSSPQGIHSVCLDSSDLSCGPCQLEICAFGDNRCLTRYSPEKVFEISTKLMSHL